MESRELIAGIGATISPSDAGSTRWDAIVIGAGPAGSLASIGLARAGIRTLLLDRVPLPRHKVCGCCLSAAGVYALQHLGLGGALHDASPLHSIRLHAGGRSSSAAIEGCVSIGRETLDARLATLARDAGAELLWPATARAHPDGAVRIECERGTITLQASVIIAADGLGGSSLRGTAAAAWRVWKRSRIGAGALLDDAPLPVRRGEIVMLCDRVGYLGLVRRPDGRIDAAAAFDAEAMRAAGGPARLASLVIGRAGGEAHAVLKGRWKGTAPLTRRREHVELGRILIVGDAAGYVEPFTGEGMTWAIESGGAIVPHAAAILRGSASAGAWTRARRRLLGTRHLKSSLIARVLRSPMAMNLALRLAAARPSLAAMVAHRIVRPTATSAGAAVGVA